MERSDETLVQERERALRRSERAEKDLESINICIRMLTNQLISESLSAEESNIEHGSMTSQTCQGDVELETVMERLPTEQFASLMALENAVHMVQAHCRLVIAEKRDKINDSNASIESYCAHWKERALDAERQTHEIRAQNKSLHMQNTRMIKEHKVLCREVRSLRKQLRESRKEVKKKQLECCTAEALTLHEQYLAAVSKKIRSSQIAEVVIDPAELLGKQQQSEVTMQVLQERGTMDSNVNEIDVATPKRNGLGFGSHVALGYGAVGKNLRSPRLKTYANARTEQLPPRTEIVTPSPRHDLLRHFLTRQVPVDTTFLNETENIKPSILKAPPQITKASLPPDLECTGGTWKSRSIHGADDDNNDDDDDSSLI